MTKRQLKHFDILSAKRAFAQGQNVIDTLRAQKNISVNTTEIIELAYDLQAGTYIKYVQDNQNQAALYTSELAKILDAYISPADSVLDIGTGELTTLSLVLQRLKKKPKVIYAFDISWSRIFKGVEFAKQKLDLDYKILRPFVADIREVPLLDKSINITTSSHALEPNGKILKELLRELFRVTIDKLVLFEPYYEINTEEGKKLMDLRGYIKNLDKVVVELGGKLIEKVIIKNISNPLNPTACFVIEPPRLVNLFPIQTKTEDNIFSVPGTNFPLKFVDNFYYSREVGICYPILKDIPILKSNSAILASSLCEETAAW
jgi:ubiquinone/menaquinone biosynthesis C-methylase UbiE